MVCDIVSIYKFWQLRGDSFWHVFYSFTCCALRTRFLINLLWFLSQGCICVGTSIWHERTSARLSSHSALHIFFRFVKASSCFQHVLIYLFNWYLAWNSSRQRCALVRVNVLNARFLFSEIIPLMLGLGFLFYFCWMGNKCRLNSHKFGWNGISLKTTIYQISVL